MGVVTLRPSATVQQGAYTTIVGGGTPHANLADGNESGSGDATAVDISASGYDATRGLILDFPNPTIPAGARITGVRVRFRARDNSSYPFDSLLRARPRLVSPYGTGTYSEGQGTSSNWGQTVLTTYSGAYETLNPYSLEWSVADVNNLLVLVTAQTQFFGSGGRVSEVWVDVQYNEPPTLTVDAPAEASVQGTNYPTIGWTYGDPDGDPLDSVHVKVFNAAQYGAGGFNPESAAAYYDSGWIGSTNPGAIGMPTPLPNDSYRAYVKARHTFGSGYFESAWDYNSFSVNVTPPPTPTVAAVALVDGGIQVTVTRGGTTPATEGYDVEYFDDLLNWQPLRFSPVVGAGTTAVVNDYEAPPNATRFYRARAYRTSSGFRIVSAYTGALVGATAIGNRWRLVDPVAGTAGIDVILEGDSFSHDSEEPTQVLWPLGRRNPVVISGTIRGEVYSITLVFSKQSDYTAFEAMRATQRVLLLKSPRGEQKYVKFVGSRAVTEDRTTGDVAPYWYTVTLSAVEQDRP